MIYVIEKDFDRQLDLLVFLAGIENYSFCGWLYPESRISAYSGHSITSNSKNLIPVTNYGDGHKPKCTETISATKNSIVEFCSDKSKIKQHFDSLAMYKIGEDSWSVATIGHEGIGLVKDDNLLIKITDAGFSASLQAPEWW